MKKLLIATLVAAVTTGASAQTYSLVGGVANLGLRGYCFVPTLVTCFDRPRSWHIGLQGPELAHLGESGTIRAEYVLARYVGIHRDSIASYGPLMPVSERVSAYRFMAGVVYEIGQHPWFTPTIGAGISVLKAKVETRFADVRIVDEKVQTRPYGSFGLVMQLSPSTAVMLTQRVSSHTIGRSKLNSTTEVAIRSTF